MMERIILTSIDVIVGCLLLIGPVSGFFIRSPCGLDCNYSSSNSRFSCTGLTLTCIPKPCCVESTRVLDLSINNITTVGPLAFQSFPNLNTLDLKLNSIQSLSTWAFQGLRYLQTLDLRNNNLQTLRAGVFEGLLNLRSLILSKNRINDVQPGTFRLLPNLKVLKLHHNALQVIYPDIFAHVTSLVTLDLDSNNIHTLYYGSFSTLSKLRTLLLANNNIASFPEFLRGLSELEELSLRGNPLYCDCSLEFLRRWFRENSDESYRKSGTCSQPSQVAGRLLGSIRKQLVCHNYENEASFSLSSEDQIMSDTSTSTTSPWRQSLETVPFNLNDTMETESVSYVNEDIVGATVNPTSIPFAEVDDVIPVFVTNPFVMQGDERSPIPSSTISYVETTNVRSKKTFDGFSSESTSPLTDLLHLLKDPSSFGRLPTTEFANENTMSSKSQSAPLGNPNIPINPSSKNHKNVTTESAATTNYQFEVDPTIATSSKFVAFRLKPANSPLRGNRPIPEGTAITVSETEGSHTERRVSELISDKSKLRFINGTEAHEVHTVLLRELVRLECPISTITPPPDHLSQYETKWLSPDGEWIKDINARRYTISNDGVLSIETVEMSHQGTYHCVRGKQKVDPIVTSVDLRVSCPCQHIPAMDDVTTNRDSSISEEIGKLKTSAGGLSDKTNMGGIQDAEATLSCSHVPVAVAILITFQATVALCTIAFCAFLSWKSSRWPHRPDRARPSLERPRIVSEINYYDSGEEPNRVSEVPTIVYESTGDDDVTEETTENASESDSALSSSGSHRNSGVDTEYVNARPVRRDTETYADLDPRSRTRHDTYSSLHPQDSDLYE